MKNYRKTNKAKYQSYIFLAFCLLGFPLVLPSAKDISQPFDQQLEQLIGATQNRWSQEFARVNGTLELRAGGSNGALISWKDKGAGGRYTWSSGDGAELRDISPWVGSGGVIRLWARFTGRETCLMYTYLGGTRKQRWEFTGVAEFEIRQ